MKALIIVVLTSIASCFGVPTMKMKKPTSPAFFSRRRFPLDRLSTQYEVYMQYSTAVYCPTTVTSKSWNCGPRCEGDLIGTVIEESIQDSDTQAAAFVATHHGRKTIVAVFRGTQSVQSFIQDIQILTTPPEFELPFIAKPSNIRVHYGFHSSYMNIRLETQGPLQALAKRYPDYEIVFTGHSLGGAMASLASVDFHSMTNGLYDDRISLITFGQPRIGNKAWAQFFDGLSFSSRAVRIVKDADPIAQLPPRFTGYVHGGRQYEINHRNQTVPCETTGPGGESRQCNDLLINQNFIAHITGYYGWWTYPWFC